MNACLQPTWSFVRFLHICELLSIVGRTLQVQQRNQCWQGQ